MIKITLTLIALLVFSVFALAAPKSDMRLNEPWVQTSDDGGVITLVYPSATSGQVECTATDFDPPSWRTIFRDVQSIGPVPLSTFIMSLPPLPGSIQMTTNQVVQARCASIRDAMALAAVAPTPPPAIPAVYIIVAPISGQTSRPLYDSRILVSANAPAIGRVEFLLNGVPRICEPDPFMRPGSSTKYYWVTNSANPAQRGLAVCKPN